jgi:hypothetical protein
LQRAAKYAPLTVAGEAGVSKNKYLPNVHIFVNIGILGKLNFIVPGQVNALSKSFWIYCQTNKHKKPHGSFGL